MCGLGVLHSGPELSVGGHMAKMTLVKGSVLHYYHSLAGTPSSLWGTLSFSTLLSVHKE